MSDLVDLLPSDPVLDQLAPLPRTSHNSSDLLSHGSTTRNLRNEHLFLHHEIPLTVRRVEGEGDVLELVEFRFHRLSIIAKFGVFVKPSDNKANIVGAGRVLNSSTETSHQSALESETIYFGGKIPPLGSGDAFGSVPIVFGISDIIHDAFSVKSLPDFVDILPTFVPEDSRGERMNETIDCVPCCRLALVEFHLE